MSKRSGRKQSPDEALAWPWNLARQAGQTLCSEKPLGFLVTLHPAPGLGGVTAGLPAQEGGPGAGWKWGWLEACGLGGPLGPASGSCI